MRKRQSLTPCLEQTISLMRKRESLTPCVEQTISLMRKLWCCRWTAQINGRCSTCGESHAAASHAGPLEYESDMQCPQSENEICNDSASAVSGGYRMPALNASTFIFHIATNGRCAGNQQDRPFVAVFLCEQASERSLKGR